MSSLRDETLQLDRADSLGPGRLTPAQERRAARIVCERTDRADALEVLRMLGLTDPEPAPTPPAATLEAARTQTQRANAQTRGQANPELIPHGTVSGYDYWRCRCLTCINGNSARSKRYRDATKEAAL